MGKVFDAMTKALVEGDRTDAAYSSAEVIDRSEHARDINRAAAEPFSFVRYSLAAAPTVEEARRASEDPPAALIKRAESMPGSEITVDPRRLDPHLVSFYNFNPRASEQYNRLALKMISRSVERGLKRILIASAHRREGRTTVALNLACALARARQRVMVVDCDFVQPGISKALGIDCKTGLKEALDSGSPAGTAAFRVRPYGFDVLPVRKPLQNTVELMADPEFWKLLQAFDGDHDFILFDSAPLLDFGDSSLLVRFTDTTVLVVESGKSSAAEMTRAMSAFTQDDILGVVLNRAAE
ncbi:MAG TPA: CpsD/CapB family tyrosine-protein kinase [Blastocatellia bacterium]|nr:CpsD/CapB family tyrosine-protein kinase [Blastocatellia bacterium]